MRDNCHIFRRLGIQYVWINCLCTIQGDLEDWCHEEARMASIYANADFVVAATGYQSRGRASSIITTRSILELTFSP